MRLSIFDSGHRQRARLFFAMTDGPAADLALIDRYHLFHAARADLLRRLGRPDEAAAVDRRFLAGRLQALNTPESS